MFNTFSSNTDFSLAHRVFKEFSSKKPFMVLNLTFPPKSVHMLMLLLLVNTTTVKWALLMISDLCCIRLNSEVGTQEFRIYMVFLTLHFQATKWSTK